MWLFPFFSVDNYFWIFDFAGEPDVQLYGDQSAAAQLPPRPPDYDDYWYQADDGYWYNEYDDLGYEFADPDASAATTESASQDTTVITNDALSNKKQNEQAKVVAANEAVQQQKLSTTTTSATTNGQQVSPLQAGFKPAPTPTAQQTNNKLSIRLFGGTYAIYVSL